MGVNRFPCEAQGRDGQTAPDIIHPGSGAVGVTNERLSSEIVFATANDFFSSAETEFETAQAFVGQRRSAQVQLRAIESSAMFDAFPHREVVGTQMLERIIGSTEF